MPNQDRVNSNGYTVFFAVLMVAVVSLLLAGLKEALKDIQQANIDNEIRTNLFKAVGVDVKGQEMKAVETMFNEQFVGMAVGLDGNVDDKVEAFKLKMSNEVKKSAEERRLPIFKYTDKDGNVQYVLQVRGNGLWDAIWMYLAVDGNFNDIKGAVFGHASETPGLGAEIKDNPTWYGQFEGKKLFDASNEYQGVSVLKGTGNKLNAHKIDGITGATMTCKGVTNLFKDDAKSSLKDYLKFIEKQR